MPSGIGQQNSEAGFLPGLAEGPHALGQRGEGLTRASKMVLAKAT